MSAKVTYGRIEPNIYNFVNAPPGRITPNFSQIDVNGQITPYKDNQGIQIKDNTFTLYSDKYTPIPISTRITKGFYYVNKAKFAEKMNIYREHLRNVEDDMRKNKSAILTSWMRIYIEPTNSGGKRKTRKSRKTRKAYK